MQARAIHRLLRGLAEWRAVHERHLGRRTYHVHAMPAEVLSDAIGAHTDKGRFCTVESTVARGSAWT
jgi:hypothetical protein